MIGLAFVMIYLVMVAQFQGRYLRLLYYSRSLLAFTGGLLGLLITENNYP